MSTRPDTPTPELALMYSTWPDRVSAQAAATTLLEENLIACANILAPMTSVYEWQGEVKQDTEVPVLFKTDAAMAERVCQRLMTLHPYEEPAILCLSVEAAGSSRAFAQWVKAQIGEPGRS